MLPFLAANFTLRPLPKGRTRSGHVVVVGGQGDVYTWGRGCKGRLGLGHEEDCCTPQEIKGLNTEDIYIVNVACSGSGTLLLSDAGTLYACGENNENR